MKAILIIILLLSLPLILSLLLDIFLVLGDCFMVIYKAEKAFYSNVTKLFKEYIEQWK